MGSGSLEAPGRFRSLGSVAAPYGAALAGSSPPGSGRSTPRRGPHSPAREVDRLAVMTLVGTRRPRPPWHKETAFSLGCSLAPFLSRLLGCVFPFSRFCYCFLSTSIKSVRYIMIRKNVQSSSLLFGQHLVPKYLFLLLLWSLFRLLFLEEMMFSFQPLSPSALNFIFSSPLFH